MPDAAHDRDAMADDRPDDRLVVERPEVLERPAAAGQDRDRGRLVGPAGGQTVLDVTLDRAQRPDQAARRRLALDLGSDEDDPGQRPAPAEDVADVLPDGAGRTRDDRDRGRSLRERPLARGVEQPFGRESRLERLETEGQVTEPGGLDRLDVQLQRTLRLE